jgi:hypothetical protein
MSIPGFIYIIGGIISIVIFSHIFLNYIKKDEDINVGDLGLLVLIDTLAFLTSWTAVITALFLKYEDKVVIKRKK